MTARPEDPFFVRVPSFTARKGYFLLDLPVFGSGDCVWLTEGRC